MTEEDFNIQIIDCEDGEIQDHFKNLKELADAYNRGDLEYLSEYYYIAGNIKGMIFNINIREDLIKENKEE